MISQYLQWEQLYNIQFQSIVQAAFLLKEVHLLSIDGKGRMNP
jgi:hypothetical protein